MLDDKATVTKVAALGVEDAVKTRKYGKTLWDKLILDSTPFIFPMVEEDLNGQFTLLNRAISLIKGKVEIKEKSVDITVSTRIPYSPLGDYLNFSCLVLPSKDGLLLDEMKMGAIPLPESIVVYMARILADLVSGQELGTITLNAIHKVSIKDKTLNLHISPIPDLKERLVKIRDRFKATRDLFPMFGDPKLVRHYYQKLIELDKAHSSPEAKSLSLFLEGVFKEADRRGGAATEENRAAILAMAIYFGSYRVGSFVGNVMTEEMKAHKKINTNATLKKRNDLTKHFIISAALKILSEKEMTHAIGEFKELIDASGGGSGFSFVDLAADRAGVKFSEIGLNDKRARQLQVLMKSNLKEELFFPDISELPENISQKEFEQYYVDVESERYRKLVTEIDECIDRLPAYRSDNKVQHAETCSIRIGILVRLGNAGRR